eukprot:2972160-Amphidinium_carterae.1
MLDGSCVRPHQQIQAGPGILRQSHDRFSHCPLGSLPVQPHAWTDVFMSAPSMRPPGLSEAGTSLNPPSHTTGYQYFLPQANMAGVTTTEVDSTSIPGGSVVPPSVGRQSELRRDRTHLPKCDIHSDPMNPTRSLTEWETFLLKAGFA